MEETNKIPDEEKTCLKRYLAQFYTAKRKQAVLKQRLAEIRAEIQDPGVPSASAARSSIGNSGRHSAGAASLTFKLAEIEDRINRQAEIEATAILDIMKMLDYLPRDSTCREILELRHIDCKPWAEIAKEVNFSKPQCFRYYAEALDRLYSFKWVRQQLADFGAKTERREKDGY